MRSIALGLLLALAAACDGYDNNDLQLVAAYTAKDLCSCLFVMEQTESYCRAWVKARPEVSVQHIDFRNKSVQSAAGLFWGATARWESERFGCVLD
jgi:hypothetical protein